MTSLPSFLFSVVSLLRLTSSQLEKEGEKTKTRGTSIDLIFKHVEGGDEVKSGVEERMNDRHKTNRSRRDITLLKLV